MKHSLGLAVMMLTFLGAAHAQGRGAAASAASPSAAAQTTPAVNVPATDFGNAQNPLLGGIPTGKPTGGIMPLSLSEALQRGLQYNLGALLGTEQIRATRGARLLALSQLLPHLNAGVTEAQEQVNLEAFGFSGFPGRIRVALIPHRRKFPPPPGMTGRQDRILPRRLPCRRGFRGEKPPLRAAPPNPGDPAGGNSSRA